MSKRHADHSDDYDFDRHMDSIRRQQRVIRHFTELIRTGDARKLSRHLRDIQYQQTVPLVFGDAIENGNDAIIAMLLPFAGDPNELLHLALGENDTRTVAVLLRHGARMPEPLGDADMACTVERFECGAKRDEEQLQRLLETERSQKDYLAFSVLDEQCDDLTTARRYFYVSKALTEAGLVLCGIAMVEEDTRNNSYEIKLLATQAPYNSFVRGKGVGSQLIETIIADARYFDIEKVTLTALRHAIPFYEKMGFRTIFDGSTNMWYPL